MNSYCRRDQSLKELVNNAANYLLSLFRFGNPLFHRIGELVERCDKLPHLLVLPIVARLDLFCNVSHAIVLVWRELLDVGDILLASFSSSLPIFKMLAWLLRAK